MSRRRLVLVVDLNLFLLIFVFTLHKCIQLLFELFCLIHEHHRCITVEAQRWLREMETQKYFFIGFDCYFRLMFSIESRSARVAGDCAKCRSVFGRKSSQYFDLKTLSLSALCRLQEIFQQWANKIVFVQMKMEFRFSFVWLHTTQHTGQVRARQKLKLSLDQKKIAELIEKLIKFIVRFDRPQIDMLKSLQHKRHFSSFCLKSTIKGPRAWHIGHKENHEQLIVELSTT